MICAPNDVAAVMEILERVREAWERGQTLGEQDTEFVAQFERRALARALADHLWTLLGGRPGALGDDLLAETRRTTGLPDPRPSPRVGGR